MIEIAYSIHDYLPLRTTPATSEYIATLWQSFETLAAEESHQTHSFALSPFHLLFMTAVQHKLFRLHKELPAEYARAFTMAPIRDDEKKILLAPTLPFDLALLHERSCFSLFEIVGLDALCITECKRIVDARNQSLMHATGKLPSDVEATIEHYLAQLESIQVVFVECNDAVAQELHAEYEPDEDIAQFLEQHLYPRFLTRADFAQGSLREHFGLCVDEEI